MEGELVLVNAVVIIMLPEVILVGEMVGLDGDTSLGVALNMGEGGIMDVGLGDNGTVLFVGEIILLVGDVAITGVFMLLGKS